MSDPVKSLERTHERWQRVAKSFHRLEQRNRFLESRYDGLLSKIEELEEEILRLRPRDTKWGFLWWSLMRPEVISVRIKSDAGHSAKYARCAIYSAMASAWKHTGFDVSIHHVGGRVWDVSRGRS